MPEKRHLVLEYSGEKGHGTGKKGMMLKNEGMALHHAKSP